MDRIELDQEVVLELEPAMSWQDPHLVPCRLRSRTGSVTQFEPLSEVTAAVRMRLDIGAPCFLTFQHGRSRVALKGVALGISGSDQIEFVAVNGVKVKDRRSAVRVPLVTALRATLVAENGSRGESVDTVTSNLSASGALLVRRPGLGDGPQWRIELGLPGGGEQIHCGAELARSTPTHFGVRFISVFLEDQVRIARLLVNRLRQQRASEPAPETPERRAPDRGAGTPE